MKRSRNQLQCLVVFQGSVLGPLLFVVYINDLAEHVKSLVYLFVDDTKISHQVSSPEDAQQLQKYLIAPSKWSFTWLLEFNTDKYHVLRIGRLILFGGSK